MTLSLAETFLSDGEDNGDQEGAAVIYSANTICCQ